nr:uncharacterized protein LOC100185600 isoform X3 [Ciona intestinalis]|eukprot:XP_026689342.1 uncharacterized protein LOC100185600 isoform X3 [Ciona intestinalis]
MIVLKSCGCAFCLQCMRTYVEVLIRDGVVISISCPDSNCETGGIISCDEIEFLSQPDTYKKYKRLKFEQDDNVIECIGMCLSHILLTFVAIHLIHSTTVEKKCSWLSLQEGKDYCNIPHSEINCYLQHAFDHSRNTNGLLPLWVEMCFFTTPKNFVGKEQDYNCTVLLEGGPVICNTTRSKTKNFTSNCTLGLFWQTHMLFPSGYIEDNLLGKSGSCKDEYQAVWHDTNTVYAADRYLAIYGNETLDFSGNNDWLRISKVQSFTWTSGVIAVVVLSIVTVIFGATFCIYKVKKVVKKSLTFDCEEDVNVKQLELVLKYTEPSISTQSDISETAEAISSHEL